MIICSNISCSVAMDIHSRYWLLLSTKYLDIDPGWAAVSAVWNLGAAAATAALVHLPNLHCKCTCLSPFNNQQHKVSNTKTCCDNCK